MQTLLPFTKLAKDNDIDDVYFDITIIINKSNEIQIIDNSLNDWKDFVDCDTLCIKEVKISIT